MGRWKVFFIAWLGMLIVLGAPAKHPLSAPPPSQQTLEIEGAGSLAIELVGMEKRPLRVDELPRPTLKGYRWDYTLRFKDTGGVGVTIAHLRITVRSDSKLVSSVERSFPFRIDPWGERHVLFSAALSMSPADMPERLTGVHELILEGEDDKGGRVEITIRVPLE